MKTRGVVNEDIAMHPGSSCATRMGAETGLIAGEAKRRKYLDGDAGGIGLAQLECQPMSLRPRQAHWPL